MIRDFICLMCPNGCHLTTETQKDKTVHVKGNRCEKGLDFAKSVLKAETKTFIPEVILDQTSPRYSETTSKNILEFWGIPLAKVHPHSIPDGSPERTLFRIVVEDHQGEFYVLEQISAPAYHAKLKIMPPQKRDA